MTSFADLQKPQVEINGKACAAVGQNGLMALYDNLFSQVKVFSSIQKYPLKDLYVEIQIAYLFLAVFYNFYTSSGPPDSIYALCLYWWSFLFFLFQLDVTSSQLLVTDNDFKNPEFRLQLRETVNTLLNLRSIPIFNENDAISTRGAPYAVISRLIPIIYPAIVASLHVGFWMEDQCEFY